MTATPEITPRTRLSADKRALLERRLRTAREVPAAAVGARPAGTPAPLSFGQERLWFMAELAPDSAAYTIPAVLRLRGVLDRAAMAQAVTGVVARHEPLRSRFPQTADGRPQLVVDPAAPVDLPLVEVDGADSQARMARAEQLYAELVATPFDLATGPLLRPILLRLAPDDHVLIVAIHHIATDGWSMDLFVTELAAWYDAAVSGAPAVLPDLPIGYGDYAYRQRERTATPAAAADLAYWRGALAGLEPLDLPTDHPRPPRQTYRGAGHTVALGGELRDAVAGLSRKHGTTLYMSLLAAVQAVLARHSGQIDFAVGTPVAGRSSTEVEHLIGLFVNLLTMRAALDDDPTFATLLARTRARCLDAYAHQDLPFEHLVQELNLPRDVRRSPLFQVLFSMQNYAEYGGRTPGGLTLEPFRRPVSATRFDLEVYANEAPEGLWLTLVYNTDLFQADTVRRLARHLETFLRAVVTDPELRLSDVDLLAPEERAELVAAPAPVAFPSDATLTGLIDATVRRCPDARAVTFAGRDLTYAQLADRADRVAARLRGLGVGPDTLVAVCAERSLELVVALLGILRAGAAYVPVDPGYPADRLAFMLSDSAAPVVLTQRRLRAALPETSALVLDLDDPAEWPDPGGPGHAGAATGGAVAADVAYVIYTSGSTGRPKGVPNTHRGIVNRLDWMQREFRLGPDDVVLQKTPASFDVSVWEFFWPLLAGARMVLAKPDGHKDAEYLRDLIVDEGVTTVHFVPSMLAVFLGTDTVQRCTALRRVICSGEELPVDLATKCLATLPAEVHNLYGPTEAAVDVTAWPCTAEALRGLARVPIGTPIQNLTVYVLDAHLRPVPVGVPGQLYLAGVGLARGYLNRPGLTAERFSPDPYGPAGSRMYATGDLARRLSDGALDFLGRIDTQVKVRGLRIELGEIETALREQPGVVDAAVIVRTDIPGDQRIAAYVVGGGDTADLRAALRRRLPDYMVPTVFVALDALPLSPSGKLDRRALPVPTAQRDGRTALVEPRTPTERLVADVWREVLGTDTIGVDDDFFDVGGHSLLATQVVARLRKVAGAGVSVLDVFQHPTVAALAALVDTPADARGPRHLLYELTRPVPAASRTLSVVCIPYGGGSAVVYQPLADALPAGTSLYSVAIPGHDVGLDEHPLPFDELVSRCAAEVLAKVDGPLVLYGHCGVGGALVVALARALEAAGRELDAVHIGAIFPFARPTGRVMSLLSGLARRERLTGNRVYENWLRSMGVDMADLDPVQAAQIIRNMRRDSDNAEAYFTELFGATIEPLRAPVISVVGERDPATEFYPERYREWHFLSRDTALVVLEEAGHFFVKYRARELADILTRVHRTGEALADPDGGWAVQGRSTAQPAPPGSDTTARAARTTDPQPSMGRFAAVALGQMVSILGSALTEFAIPLWIYLETGSLVNFAIFAVLGLVPGMLVAPLAGAVVDRYDRRRVMLLGDLAAGGSQAVLLALAWTGRLEIAHIYGLIVTLSIALTFQRLAYASAVPQLVPKRFLGHANGVAQLGTGLGQFLVPLAAAALLAGVGLRGILLFDVVSYVVAVLVLLVVRFPDRMPWRRRESLASEILGGLRFATGRGGFLGLLMFFAVLNLFLAPPFLLLSPLVLSFADLGAVARVSMAAGLGAIVGALVMTFWGGPRQERTRGMLLSVLVLAGSCAVVALYPAEPVVAVGAFGMSLGLTLVNGIYTTIVQVKVPQRFHGRVFSINTVIAFSTMPVAYGIIAPFGSRLFEPLLASGGPLAGNVGVVLGVGPGRGTALLYLVFAVAMAAQALIALRLPSVGGFDRRVPDALPDDLIGARAWAARAGSGPGTPPTPGTAPTRLSATTRGERT